MQWTFSSLRSEPTRGSSAEDKCELLKAGSSERKDCEYDAETRRSSPNAGKTNRRALLIAVALTIVGAIVAVVSLATAVESGRAERAAERAAVARASTTVSAGPGGAEDASGHRLLAERPASPARVGGLQQHRVHSGCVQRRRGGVSLGQLRVSRRHFASAGAAARGSLYECVFLVTVWRSRPSPQTWLWKCGCRRPTPP